MKESSDGETLMAVGIWFQIWGAAEEKARRPKSVFTSANGSLREVNDPLCVFSVLYFFCLFGIVFLSRRSADCHQTRATAHT